MDDGDGKKRVMGNKKNAMTNARLERIIVQFSILSHTVPLSIVSSHLNGTKKSDYTHVVHLSMKHTGLC